MERVLRACQRRGEAFLMATHDCVPGPGRALVSASRMARLRMLGMLDDAIREHAVDIIDRMHWVVNAARACLRR
ncbi:hypothetical protein [Rhodococcus erythropolis]|uniref:hypothetical protein n=1 Tax=Rhodococcus erythropolis TaxID=1833 RepID=UPI001112CB6A|nr:hypothetical protein [Rhodococcus erythropolis]